MNLNELSKEELRLLLTRAYLDPVVWFRDILGFTIKPFHKEWIDLLFANNRLAISAPTGHGKCFGKDTKIMMYDCSIKNVEDISIDDLIMGDDSKPRKVISLTRGKENLYNVKQVKGNDYIINESHILSLRMGYNASYYKKNEIVDISLIDYLKSTKNFKNCSKGYKVGLQFEHQDIKLDPYILGVWLGDGTSNSPQISNMDKEVIDYIKEYTKKENLELRIYPDKRSKSITLSICKGKNKTNLLIDSLRYYNLTNNKHIPDEYLYNNEEIRLNILAGIIDTDGYTNRNTIDLIQKDKILSEDIVFLARSLGFCVSINKSIKTISKINFSGEYYRIIISGNTDKIPLKLNRRKCTKRLINKNNLHTGIILEPLGIGNYYGFEIIGNNKRFLLSDFTVVHNTSIFGIGYPLWLAYYKPRSKSIVISKTIRTQSANVLEDIKFLIDTNPILKSLIPLDNSEWSKEKIICSNGSQIFYSSYSSNIRGAHVDYIFCDEISTYMDDMIFYRDVSTRVDAKKGKIACVSTPINTTDLLAQLLENKSYVSKVYPAILDGNSIWEERFPVDWHDGKRKEIGNSQYERNYMVNPHAESESPIFSLSSIEDCYDTHKTLHDDAGPNIVVIGVDLAISSGIRADFDVYTVIEIDQGNCIMRYAERIKGVPIETKVIKLKQIYEMYKNQATYIKFIIDESNIGHAIIEDLRKEGIPVEGQAFNSAARNMLLTNLKRIIDSKRLVIPRDLEDPYTITFTNKLTEELIGFKEKESPTTKIKHLVSDAAHDDTVMSLALACKEAIVRKPFNDYIASGND